MKQDSALFGSESLDEAAERAFEEARARVIKEANEERARFYREERRHAIESAAAWFANHKLFYASDERTVTVGDKWIDQVALHAQRALHTAARQVGIPDRDRDQPIDLAGTEHLQWYASVLKELKLQVDDELQTIQAICEQREESE